MEQLVRLTFNGSVDDILASYNTISIYDTERLAYLNTRASCDYYTSDKYVCFLLIDENEQNIYENVLESNNIVYLCDNITLDVIDNKIDILTQLNSNINPENVLIYEHFKIELEQWIYENLTIDNILDRINLHGIESLREIDYDFLDTN